MSKTVISTQLPKGSIPYLEARNREIIARQKELNAITEGEEARDLTDVEDTEFENLETEFQKNKTNLERQKRQKDRAFAFSERGEKKEKEKLVKRHSITKVLSALAFPNKRQLDGVELEMHQEAEKEARTFNRDIEGYGIPSFFMGREKRDLTVGTNTAGGHTVATELGEMIPYLQPKLMVEALGATVLSGLSSNLDLPRNNGITSAVWEGETDDNAESDPTFDKISLTPKRLGAYTDFSKQLLLQSSISIDNFVAQQLTRAIQIKLDATAINGSGSSPEPTGILNISGIGDVAIGTNGGAPTRDALIDLTNSLATNNADMGSLAFLTTPTMRAKLQKTKTDSGSGLFVWNQPNSLIGYRAEVSTQVPSTLTKGSSSDCHAIIYANWAEFIMAQWGGLDLVVDPYTLAIKSVVRIVANSWWDFNVMHNKSFAAIQDARNV